MFRLVCYCFFVEIVLGDFGEEICELVLRALHGGILFLGLSYSYLLYVIRIISEK